MISISVYLSDSYSFKRYYIQTLLDLTLPTEDDDVCRNK